MTHLRKIMLDTDLRLAVEQSRGQNDCDSRVGRKGMKVDNGPVEKIRAARRKLAADGNFLSSATWYSRM